MIHTCVCAVRRGIDAKTKNCLHTQGLEVVKSVKSASIAWALETIDSSIVSEINTFWLSCSGV